MKKEDDESILKYLNENIYCKAKNRIFSINIHVEYNMMMNYLMETKTIKTFYLREMHGISWVKSTGGTKFNNNLEFIYLFPKKRGDILELKDFSINNINSKSMLLNNYIFKGNIIYVGGWENHKKTIFRMKLLNNINQKVNNELSNFIDVIVSFYLDINDNSTVIISECFYDINENVFSRFFEIHKIFYEKIKLFFEKNVNIYFCNESILINRNITQILNYIMTLKIFHNKRFEIKEIQKFQNEINIFIDIRDKQHPESVYSSRCHILKLSEISSFVSIIALIDVKFFSINKRFSTLKAAIIFVLKLLKKNIEKELLIETSK
jgi:hypothetical protein